MRLPSALTWWLCDDPSPRYSALDRMDGLGEPRCQDQPKGDLGEVEVLVRKVSLAKHPPGSTCRAVELSVLVSCGWRPPGCVEIWAGDRRRGPLKEERI